MSDMSPEQIEAFLGDLDMQMGTQEQEPGLLTEPQFVVDIEDVEPLTDEDDPFKGATTRVGDGSCVTCGSPTFRPPGLTKAGHRKRVPKYCDLHSPNISVPPSRSNTKGVESQLSKIQEELADDIRLLAALAGPLLPVTGMYVFEAADPFTIALIKLAKNNQGILRILHRAAQVAPIYTLGSTIAGVAYSVQVDVNHADPHNTIAKRLGVQRAYQKVHPEEASSNGQMYEPMAPPMYGVQ